MLTFGLTVAAIGMGVVFTALVFLVGVIKVLGYAAAIIDRAGASKAAPVPKAAARRAAAAAAPAAPKAEAAAAAPAKAQQEDDGEVQAVIAASVAAYTRKS